MKQDRMPNATGLAFPCALLLLLLASCDGRDPVSRFEGVLSANGVTFTSSFDQCVMSFIYDNFLVGLQGSAAAPAASAPKTGSRHISLAASHAARGKTFTFDLRGYYYGAQIPSRLTVMIGGKAFDVPLPAGDDVGQDFYHRIEGQLAADADVTPIVMTATIPQPQEPGSEALLAVDSIDIALPPDGRCRPLAEEKRGMKGIARPPKAKPRTLPPGS